MHTVEGDGFEIHFSWNGDYLRAQVEGRHDSHTISLAYWTCIAHQRLQVGARRLLVLENLGKSEPSQDLLLLFEELLELDFSGCKIAFIDRGDDLRSQLEYVAILAREHDIQTAIFSEESEAATWIRHGEE